MTAPMTDTFDPAAAFAALIVERNALRVRVTELEAKAKSPVGKTLAQYLQDLLNDADKEDVAVDDIGEQEIWDRLVSLVQNDDEDFWAPEKEWDVRVLLTVAVTGKVVARTAEQARSLVAENPPEVRIDDEGALSSADVDDSDVDNIEVDEA